MDVDYLVVKEMINISKLFVYSCMFRIGCKTYYDIYSNMAKTCLKVLKDSCSRLRKSLSLEAFACLEV
jgi:hypothetical protein